jgi:hypothetical protein
LNGSASRCDSIDVTAGSQAALAPSKTAIPQKALGKRARQESSRHRAIPQAILPVLVRAGIAMPTWSGGSSVIAIRQRRSAPQAMLAYLDDASLETPVRRRGDRLP